MTSTAVEVIPDEAGIIELVHKLEKSGALTHTSLTLPDDLSFTEYVGIGIWLQTIRGATAWWVGDWLNYGERSIEAYDQAQSMTGMEESTLGTWAWTADQIPPQRRVEGVHWSLHRMVAALPAREQTRLLRKAKKEGWKARDMREQISPTQDPLFDQPAANGGGPVLHMQELVEVSKAIVRDMKDADDPGFMLVPVETIKRLLAALGQED